MPRPDTPAPGSALFTAPLWGDLEVRSALHPGTEAGRERNLRRLRGRRLFADERAFEWYRSWDLEGLVGAVYPYVDDVGLDLCNYATTFMTVYDDQFEGTSATASAEAAAEVRTCLGVIDERTDVPATSPLTGIFTEIWHEWLRAGLSAEWHARVRTDWVYCLTSMAHERVALRTGRPLLLDQYLWLRRGTSYMPLFLDLIELAGGRECPRIAFHAPPLQIMRCITMDVVNYMNDVLSLHKEMARGDNDNIVLTLRGAYDCSLDEAISRVCASVREQVRRFSELHGRLPEMCADLGLSGAETEAVLGYGHGLECWIGGYDPWQRSSARYTAAFAQRPADQRWAFRMGRT
ncbi:terpene synthase family protein [Streptomyces sp. NPDC093018]|uniref:terpene synthase family protein n=1 Tax=Streptomyces sp. NPDC093018 TaxID=3155067 RepID=UPI003427A91F